jgi:hypothetical protein
MFMETTVKPARISINEIMGLLVDSNASNIAMQYVDRKISGISFVYQVGNSQLAFALPIRIEPIFNVLQADRVRQREKYIADDQAKAERIAWRQLLRWLEAQLVMIDLGMVAMHEVFMPYQLDNSGRTMFQVFESQRLLGPGDPK